MATHLLRKLPTSFPTFHRSKTTSSQYVSSRARDATFEKLMDQYKHLHKVNSIQDLILSNPVPSTPSSISVDFLNRLSQTLHLNRGAPAFLRRYPHIFTLYHDPLKSATFCKLTPQATHIVDQETAAIAASLPLVIDRLVKLLSMSVSKILPLRAIFKVWKELGLPDDFEDSVILQNPNLFRLLDAHEPNTHLLELVPKDCDFSTAVENWRVMECCKDDASVDRTEIRFSFKQGYPPGMRLKKNFRAKVKEWQEMPYIGPYEEVGEKKVKMSKGAMMGLEKRAVGIVHEFLSLTVEKMVEVEKISHFRKWFGIDLNIRDLFLDHPGIFYLSTKGKRHTVFLREAYERGCLIERNPVYDARRKLLDLVVLRRRGMNSGDFKTMSVGEEEGDGSEESESD